MEDNLSWRINKYWEQFNVKSEHYLNRYINFIKSIQDKGERNLDYFERHHIVPKSFVENDNIIKLTAREHFIAHHILARAFGDKMVFAFQFLCSRSVKYNYFKVTSRIYEELKIMNSNVMKERWKFGKMRGIPRSAKTRRRIGNAVQNSWNNRKIFY